MAKDKRDVLLAFLHTKGKSGIENEDVMGSIMLMKQMFLVDKEIESEDRYDFVPYDLGPVSFELYEDVENLKREGLVVEIRRGRWSIFRLTKKGIEKARNIVRNNLSESEIQSIKKIKTDFNRSGPTKIIKYVYTKYPKMATKSIIKNIS